MFASGTGSMRGPRMKTPLLLLLLLTTLTGTVLCENEDDGTDTETNDEETEVEPVEEADPSDSGATSAPDPTEYYSDPGQTTSPQDYERLETTVDSNVTGSEEDVSEEEEVLSPIVILIPVVLVVIIIGMIVCGIFINRRWNEKVRNQELRKEDPYLDGSSTEKVPMPMFEEDVPSVLELEMEELGQWMKKDVEPAEDFKHA
ncbi:hypothetical protein VZT92_003014 [Zoarces viviparus]|uniref:Transmembrane protein 154 n=1 Tax=Zoarces viviparus TaxID=48416 RepID=A0AAW1G001_ZOAVI